MLNNTPDKEQIKNREIFEQKPECKTGEKLIGKPIKQSIENKI